MVDFMRFSRDVLEHEIERAVPLKADQRLEVT